MNIYQKMSAITADMQTVAKNLTVSTGKGYGYKAVSERDIIDAVKPLEIKHGVYSYPFSRDIIESQMLDQESSSGTRTQFYTKLMTTYRFVNVDEPTEFIDIVSYSVGLDSGDKGDGKAMTYGDKYALMKAYKISTGDDPDEKASEDSKFTKSGKKEQPLASQTAKDTITNLCKMMDLKVTDILAQTGWTPGNMLTQAQADKAVVIIKSISEEREKAK